MCEVEDSFVDRCRNNFFFNFATHAASYLEMEAERVKEMAEKSRSSQGATRSGKRRGGADHQTHSQGHPHSPYFIIGHSHSENFTTDLAGC